MEFEMTSWNECINIGGSHRLFTSGKISLQDLSRNVVRRLKNTQAFANSESELIDIMCAFEAIDELAQLEDYKTVLDMLYDFGDKDHKLWIETNDVSPQEHDDTPVMKTKNPFDDDTKPTTSWVKPADTSDTSNLTASYKTDFSPPQWSKEKMYEVGDIVAMSYARYQCIIACANIDPVPNSYNKPTDCWKWLGASKVSFDPSLAFIDRITCAVPTTARTYPATRKYHYMSEDEFNKKLVAAEINPANLPKDLYSYMKDCEEPYQEWLIGRFNKGNMTFKGLDSIG